MKRLYEGDISDYNNDSSSADFAFLSHLAFWTSKDSEQMRSVWLSSPLGSRQKTQQRKDYQDRSIRNAIDATHETYQPFSPDSLTKIDYDFMMQTAKDGTKTVPCIFPNITRVIRKHPFFKDSFRFNSFSKMTETTITSRTSPKKWEQLTDGAISITREYITENFPAFRRLTVAMTTEAILTASHDNSVNPPRDFLTSLTWDKTPRLNSWLHHTFGTPDDELNQSIGSNWIKGLVNRVLHPGCQFDEALALESPQGWRKSTAMRVLGAPWHVETAHSIDNKDFYILLAQNVIVEFSEGEIFDRSSMKKIKAEITKTEDQFRPPYERGMVKFPRSCVFAVTTNSLELKDDTGNRRWLPVTLQKPADIDWLRANRDQLFAEAYHRVAILNETTHEYPKESLELLQESKGEFTGYDEKALIWFASLSDEIQKEGLSVLQAAQAVFEVDNISKYTEMQMASILNRTLKMDKVNKRVGGSVLKRWVPTEKTMKLIEGFTMQPEKIFPVKDIIPF